VSEKTRSDPVLIGFFEFALYFFISLKGQIAKQAGGLLRMSKWFFNRDFNYLQRKLNDEV